jgi:hypothetical protein
MVSSGLLRRVALVRTRAVRRNNPEDTILHSHRRENLKSYIELSTFFKLMCWVRHRPPVLIVTWWGPLQGHRYEYQRYIVMYQGGLGELRRCGLGLVREYIRSRSQPQQFTITGNALALAASWILLWTCSELSSTALLLRSDSNRFTNFRVRVRVTLRLTVGQSVCLGVEPRPGLMTRCSLTLWKLRSCLISAPSLTRGRVCPLSV